jgi:hypothetical protein
VQAQNAGTGAERWLWGVQVREAGDKSASGSVSESESDGEEFDAEASGEQEAETETPSLVERPRPMSSMQPKDFTRQMMRRTLAANKSGGVPIAHGAHTRNSMDSAGATIAASHADSADISAAGLLLAAKRAEFMARLGKRADGSDRVAVGVLAAPVRGYRKPAPRMTSIDASIESFGFPVSAGNVGRRRHTTTFTSRCSDADRQRGANADLVSGERCVLLLPCSFRNVCSARAHLAGTGETLCVASARSTLTPPRALGNCCTGKDVALAKMWT